MRCLICGRLSLPGAKLCLDCKAARKRAFDATVTQPLLAAAGEARGSMAAPRLLRPSQSVPDAARRAAKMALAAQAEARIAIESPPRRAAPWPIILGLMCIGLVAVGYFGHWFGGGKSDTYATVPVGVPVTRDSPAPPVARAPTAAPTAVPASATATVPVTNSAVAIDASTAAAANADAAKRAIARTRLEKAPVTLPPNEPTPPPVITVARPPPPPVVREAPRPDRWQLMADAIARCPRGDFFSPYSCEQRVRAQYCDDGKFQLQMLSHSGFAPLSRSMGPMLKEESFHLGTGLTGLKRVAKAGVIPVDIQQKFHNKWLSGSLDLFGNDHSTSAVWAYIWGIKGRPEEDKEAGIADKERLNDYARRQYYEECAKLVGQVNASIQGDEKLYVPDIRFNRQIGEFAGKRYSVEGSVMDSDLYEQHLEQVLPTEADEKLLVEFFKREDWLGPKAA